MTQTPTWNGGPTSTTSGRAAPGTVIGERYQLRSPVGNGGMGTVWRATDTLLRRDVAVKEVVLPPGLAPSDRDAMYERTLREARAAAALQHPAVVQVYDVVTNGDRPWIVMELLEARSLADLVIEDGPLAPRAVAKIGIALLGALEVAHAAGVLHRDVKPANVLICNDGRCVLTDFGVARMPTDVQLTTPGMVLGSPHFISPERAMGHDFGPPSDLFSLGVTLYTAVEGKPPFDRGDPIETMHSVVEDEPVAPSRCGPLEPVLMGLLVKDPGRRMDVHVARGMLRELLAGALTNKAAVNTVTDPYAVVPPQPSSWQPPAVEAPKPTGQIGGRAMLGPEESLTDRLAALRRGERPEGTEPTDAAAGALDVPTGAMPAAGPTSPSGPGTTHGLPQGTPPTGPTAPQAAQPAPAGTPYGTPQTTQPVNYGTQPGFGVPQETQPVSYGVPAGYGTPQTTQPVNYGTQPGFGVPQETQPVNYGGPWSVPGTGQPWAAPGGVPTSSGAAGGVKGWPRNKQLAVAGGALAVLLVLVIGSVALFGGDPDPTNQPQAQATASAPAQTAVPMQPFNGKGMTLNVPRGWKKNSAGVWTDFVDPDDAGRKVRILVEGYAGSSSLKWAEGAANNLRTKSKSCTKPYNQLAMTEVELGGQPAAEFEYNCGEGEAMRHGVWRGVLHEGKVYSFYLTSTDARFAESRAIFDEMVKSFQFNPAG